MRKLLPLLLALILAFSMSVSAMADVVTYPAGEKLGDVRVRQALLYALDRANFIPAEYGSEELASVGLAPISPTSWAFPDESELNAYEYDLDKAAALLDEAGWTLGEDGYRYNANGTKLSLKWLVYYDSTWPGTLSAMAADSWKKIGVDLQIELMDFNTVGEKTMDAKPLEKDFDIYTMGFSLDIDPDPAGGLFDYDAFSEGGYNASGYYNERAQELIALGKNSFDVEERAAYYKEWAKIMNEQVPTSIVAYRSEIWGINDRVSGLDIGTYANWAEIISKVTLEGDQTLRFGETSFDGVFNPIMADNVYDMYINTLAFNGLVKTTPEAEFAPLLADWELINDNKTYSFTLKDGVCFSDGTPLTTKDVEFTYMTIAHPDYNGPRLYVVSDLEGYDEYAAGTADTISGIEVIDEKTINFTFKVASPSNINSFTYGILNADYYAFSTWEEFTAKIDKPFGSGQLVLDSYAPGEYLSLTPNANYWDAAEAVKVEGVYITVIPEESKIAALQMGELDFAQLTAQKDNVNAIEAMPGVSLLSYLGNGYTFMCFNTLH